MGSAEASIHSAGTGLSMEISGGVVFY